MWIKKPTRCHLVLDTKRIILYTRYIDDLLIIYDAAQINLDTIIRYANSINSNLELNPTPENNNRVSFLDLAIIRNTPHLEIDIFHKPTTTDTTIHYLSNHPQEHKLAAYRFLINRMPNLPLNKNRREHEWQTILQIAKNNHFPIALIHNQKHRMMQERKQLPSPSPTQPTQPTKSEKWATFTFSFPQIRKVTKLLKKTRIKIAFRSNNTLAHLIKTTTITKTPPHNRPGIYQLV